MYFTDDSLFPEHMQPPIIMAAPFGPEWLPGRCDIPLTWDEQVQRAVDCYNAGATMLRGTAAGRAAGKAEGFSAWQGMEDEHMHIFCMGNRTVARRGRVDDEHAHPPIALMHVTGEHAHTTMREH